MKRRTPWSARVEPAVSQATTYHVADITAAATAGSVTTGRVWLVLDGSAFPDSGWWDLPVSVLSTAVLSYRRLMDGPVDEEFADSEAETSSYFFEGSYYLAYRRIEGDTTKVYLEANCDTDEDNPVSIAVGEVLLTDVRDALARAVDDVLGALEGKPHAAEDVAILRGKKADLAP